MSRYSSNGKINKEYNSTKCLTALFHFLIYLADSQSIGSSPGCAGGFLPGVLGMVRRDFMICSEAFGWFRIFLHANTSWSSC